MSAKKMTTEDYFHLGVALSKAQNIEFALYGILTHVNKDLGIIKNKRLRQLTPRQFLSSNPEYKSLRMMTLGQLNKELPQGFGISPDLMQDYVERRNLVTHDFMREIDPKYATNGTLHPKTFLTQFISDSETLEQILLGLLYVMMDQIAEKNNLPDRKPSGEKVDKAKAAFYSHAFENKSQ